MKKQYNALTSPDNQQQSVAVTHPFSPLRGQTLTLIKEVRKGGKDWLVCQDDSGNVRYLQTSWTNYLDTDMCGETMKTDIHNVGDFKYEDLEMLSKLLNSLEEV